MIFESIQPEVAVTKPLFPLPLVLFPGGRLPLQIFEARYLDMVGQCMRDGEHFIVTMSRRLEKFPSSISVWSSY